MQPVDLLVQGPHFYTMAGEGVGYLADAAMAVDRGRIVAIGPRRVVAPQFRAERTIDASGHAVLPGFLDVHMHSHLCVLRGLAQDTSHWMMYGLGPFSQVASPEALRAGSRLALVEALRNGTTTFGDYGRDMAPVCEFVQKLGTRGRITGLIREAASRIYDPGELYDFEPELGRRSLEDCLALHERWKGGADGRITVVLGPQGPDFLSKELLLEVKRHARELGTKIHLHTAQGDRETAQMEMRYGKRPVPWLDEIGYLDEALLAVHLTDATEDEARLVAQRGASMALCSGSIGIIDGIVPPARAFQDAGGMVGLGSDQAPGNNCHSVVNEMKLTALFNKIRAGDPEAMPAWRVLRMATIEGAHACGLGHEVGSLEEGKRADFLLIDLSKPTLAPLYEEPMRNFVPNLVYAARGDEVSTVVVDGRVIVGDGRVLTVDEREIVADAQRYAGEIGKAAAETFWKVGGTNARFMREGRL